MSSIFHKSLWLGCKGLWHLKMVFAAFRERLMEMLADVVAILPLKVSVMCLKGSGQQCQRLNTLEMQNVL